MQTRTLPLLAAFSAAFASTPLLAQDVLQVRASEVVRADGSRIENGLLFVRDGKIVSITTEAPDPALPLIEHDGVLSAGLVACQSASGASREAYDNARSLLPEARMAHAFRPDHSDFADALEAGITTLVLAPSDRNVSGGSTAVVKTAGGTVLSDAGHLSISMTGSALSDSGLNFSRFFGNVDSPDADFDGSTPNGGPEITDRGRRGTRPPTSYAGMLRRLEEELASSDGAFARAKAGELPIFLTAWDRNEVARAATFASAHGLRGALRGAPLAGDPGLVPLLAESGLGLVLGPFDPGHATPSLEGVRALQEAGIPFGFALAQPARSANSFRLSAALALSAGADAQGLLRALTSDAAAIAGVERRVGSLAPGLDADFVLWSGDPLDLSSRAVAVFVDGAAAWTAEER